MNNLILGMNTIAALLGYNKYGNVEFNKNDIEIISEITNIFFDKKKNVFPEKSRVTIFILSKEKTVIFALNSKIIILYTTSKIILLRN